MQEENLNNVESNIGTFTSSKTDFSYPQLVMRAIEDCRIKRAVEMKEGYFNDKLDKQGNIRREWIPDTRKIFISSVDGLKDLLAPEIKNDKVFQKIMSGVEISKDEKTQEKKLEIKKGQEVIKVKTIAQKNIQGKLDEIFDKFAYEKIEQTKEGWEKTGFKYLPQINEEVAMISVRHENRFDVVEGGWNHKVNSYHDAKIPIYDELFSELVNICSRLGYFKKKTTAG